MRNSSLKRSGMARVNVCWRITQFYLPPTLIPKWNEARLPLRPSRAAELTGLWPLLIFRPAEGRRLIWPEVR